MPGSRVGQSERSMLVAKLVVVGVVYFVAVRLSLDVIEPTQLWPAAGIGLAAILRWGPWMLLATIPADALAELSAGLVPGFAVAAALAEGAEAGFAAWLLGRLRFDRLLGSPRDVMVFVLVGAVAAPTLGALLGTAGLAWSGQNRPDQLLGSFWLWWVGNSVGVLVVTPLLVLTDRFARGLRERGRAVEAALAAGTLLLVGVAVFGPFPGLGAANRPISFAVFPVVVWAALRLGVAGAALANALIAAIAVWGTLGGNGPFVQTTNGTSFLFTWFFLAFTSIASLAFAALVATRDRTERELREANEALKALESATQAGSWIWRPDLSLHLGSARQREIHGVAKHTNPIPQEVLLESIHPDDRRRILREFSVAWEVRGRIETEYRVVRADGGVRWLAVSGGCVPIDASRPAGPLQMVGVHVDVTERKQMEATVRRSERLVSLGTFAAGVAHELNNPLGTILLAAESARSSAPDREFVAHALDDIVEDAQRAARIVQSVLRFSKQEATERSLLDLGECLPHAIDLTRLHCRRHGVALEIRIEPRPLEVLANSTELEQLVQNLVRNGAEACSKGGRIQVAAKRVEEEILLTVADDGRGMTASEIEQAFDPFYTTRSQEGGSGLGLSICHGIARAHDGRIEIESAPGYGTRVRVWLPCAAPDASRGTEAGHGATAAG